MFYRIVYSCYVLQNSSTYVLKNSYTYVIHNSYMFYRTVPLMSRSTEQPHSCHVLQNSPIHVMFHRIVPLMSCSTEQSHSYYVLQNSPTHVMFYRTVPLIHTNDSKSDINNLKTYIMGLIHMSHHSCSPYHYSLLDI